MHVQCDLFTFINLYARTGNNIYTVPYRILIDDITAIFNIFPY